MAIQVNKAGDIKYAVVASYNALRKTVAIAAEKYHADVTSRATAGDPSAPTAAAATCATADATNEPTSVALANALKALWNAHFADALAHLAADTANAVSTAAATDYASAATLANALQTKYNAHLSQSGVHATTDTNTDSTTTATTDATTRALLNALKAAYNIHVVHAPLGSSLALVGP